MIHDGCAVDLVPGGQVLDRCPGVMITDERVDYCGIESVVAADRSSSWPRWPRRPGLNLLDDVEDLLCGGAQGGEPLGRV